VFGLLGLIGWPAVWPLAAILQMGFLTLMVMINLYARQSLTPRINQARDAGDAQKGRFDRLHRQSVILNGIVLLLGLIVLLMMTRTMTHTISGG
jgi:hypothetical protein